MQIDIFGSHARVHSEKGQQSRVAHGWRLRACILEEECRMQIALALYPHFTMLDIIGPFQVLADVPGHEITFVRGRAGPCPRSHRPSGPRRVTILRGCSNSRHRRGARWVRGHRATGRARPVAARCPRADDVDNKRVHRVDLSRGRGRPGRDRGDHSLGAQDALEQLGVHYTAERVVERGKGHHRRRRVERYRHGAHAAGPDVRRRDGGTNFSSQSNTTRNLLSTPARPPKRPRKSSISSSR